MTKDKYLSIRNNSDQDMLPLYYFLWKVKGGKHLSPDQFQNFFWLWVFRKHGLHSLPKLQWFVFKELDKHFGIKTQPLAY